MTVFSLVFPLVCLDERFASDGDVECDGEVCGKWVGGIKENVCWAASGGHAWEAIGEACGFERQKGGTKGNSGMVENDVAGGVVARGGGLAACG